jgi:hypothetical protein
VTVQPNGFIHIKMPELAYSRVYRRTYLTGVLAKAVVGIAKVLGKPNPERSESLVMGRPGSQKLTAC